MKLEEINQYNLSKRLYREFQDIDSKMDLVMLKDISIKNNIIKLIFMFNVYPTLDLLIQLPPNFPFQRPQYFIIDQNNDQKISIKKFLYDNKEKSLDWENLFNQLNNMEEKHSPTTKISGEIDKIMNIFKELNYGWYI